MKTLENDDRKRIIELFARNFNLKFNELEKLCSIRSNELSYHLKNLVEDGILKKDGDNYLLTSKGETITERISHFTGKEVGHMVVVIVAVTKGKQILLIKRDKRPFQGYWGMIGGKTRFSESIPDAVEREVEEETGIKINKKTVKVRSVLLERVKTNQGISHGNILILTEAKPINNINLSNEHLGWFELSELKNNKLILSDLWMIDNFIKKHKEVKIPHIIMNEENGNLTSFKVN
jgi:ADP-ribose pyrophosphatase YjhB (NUDIX family)/predicted transcriptional regulator